VSVTDNILSVTLLLNTQFYPCPLCHTYISGHSIAYLHVFALSLDGTAAAWMKSSVFIHLMQLPSNPIIFGFGQLVLRCDFSKTKIQPLTLFLTPISILSIDIQQYYHYQSLCIDTMDLNIHSSPLPAFYIHKISHFNLEINGNINFKVGRESTTLICHVLMSPFLVTIIASVNEFWAVVFVFVELFDKINKPFIDGIVGSSGECLFLEIAQFQFIRATSNLREGPVNNI